MVSGGERIVGCCRVRSLRITSVEGFGGERLTFDFAYLPGEHECCDDSRYEVANRIAAPDSVKPEMLRENKQKRNHKDNLACERKEHCLARHAETLEEVGAHNLEADNPEGHRGDL